MMTIFSNWASLFTDLRICCEIPKNCRIRQNCVLCQSFQFTPTSQFLSRFCDILQLCCCIPHLYLLHQMSSWINVLIISDITTIIIVIPAASKPTMRILMSFFPNSWFKIDENVIPMAGNICICICMTGNVAFVMLYEHLVLVFAFVLIEGIWVIIEKEFTQLTEVSANITNNNLKVCLSHYQWYLLLNRNDYKYWDGNAVIWVLGCTPLTIWWIEFHKHERKGR